MIVRNFNHDAAVRVFGMTEETTMSIDVHDGAAPSACSAWQPSRARCRLPPGLVLAREARSLFGEDWQAPLARLIDVPERMLDRIAQAAGAGSDYPGSAAALKRFSERLAALAATTRKESQAVQRRGALAY